MRILVSACLLGLACRYDGAAKPREEILALKERHELIPVCPEQLGGLPTPRPPAEIQGEQQQIDLFMREVIKPYYYIRVKDYSMKRIKVKKEKTFNVI